jgi:prepilin-type N-terminal cleavage/methylation domain-containing protein
MRMQFIKRAFSLIELSVVIIVIGILVAGIVSGRRMIIQAKLKSAQSLTRSSGVLAIPNLVFWIEPTLDGAMTSVTNGQNPANGDKISSWNDISGRQINVSQNVSGSRPSYIASGINGLPALDFDGGDSLDSSIAPISNRNDAYTIISVWQIASSPGSYAYVFSQCATAAGNGTCASSGVDFNALPGGFDFNASGSSFNYKSSLVPDFNKPYITILSINDTLTNNVRLYANELNTPVLAASGSQGSLSLGNNLMSIGGKASSGFNFDGKISEVIVFDRYLKNYEVDAINSYLSRKYGITLS